MTSGVYITVAGIGLCAAGAAILYWRSRKKKSDASEPKTAEKNIPSAWVAVLTTDARVFNGLFSGLQRVANGTAKKPEKILREWCQRTHYTWENEPADTLCQEQILPLIEKEDRDGLMHWAKVFLAAAHVAGITKEAAMTLVLTESNSADYVDWEGTDLFPEDEVEVITPAWYQNGKLLEQGQCKKFPEKTFAE